jgi:hypothetical protein
LFTGPDTPSEKEIAWGAKELKEKIARSASKAAKAQAERAAVLQSVQP